MLGCVVVAFTVRSTRNFSGTAVKECSALSNSDRSPLIAAIREAMSAIMIFRGSPECAHESEYITYV